MIDVVAIADEGQNPACQTAEVLTHRQQIRQGLEWVLIIREGIEDRDARL